MKLFNQLWAFFASVKLAIFTLCSLAVTSIIGTIIPQGEPYSFYVKNYGAKTAQFFHILNIPEMYYSWWFLGLLGLLSANLIICSLDRLPAVVKIITADNLAISPERIEKMVHNRKWQISSDHPTLLKLSTVLESGGWNAVVRPQGRDELYFSQKNRWSRIGVYCVHLSILIIFIGAIIGHFFGFKGSVMIPEMRSTEKVYSTKTSTPIDLGFEVRCESFAIEFYDNGMPKEYKSSLSVLENNQVIEKKDIEVNSPLTYRGITFYQSSYEAYKEFVFSITEKTTGETNQRILPFQQQMSWDEKQIQFGIINAEAIGQRVVRAKVWFKAGDNPATIHWLADNVGTTITSGGAEYLLTAKQMYATGLQVAKDPGVWVVYFGCGLMMLGLYMAFFLAHQRIWLYKHVDAAGTTLYLGGSANKNKPVFARNFSQLEALVDRAISG
jgi:cytochrome c biogenesis protein